MFYIMLSIINANNFSWANMKPFMKPTWNIVRPYTFVHGKLFSFVIMFIEYKPFFRMRGKFSPDFSSS
jgi:hypothetical protein